MRFTWDENKRKTNIRNHGLDFKDAKSIFEKHHLTVQDARFDYSEERYLTVGLLEDIVIAIAHTENEDTIRIISARKATKNEQKDYFKSFQN